MAFQRFGNHCTTHFPNTHVIEIRAANLSSVTLCTGAYAGSECETYLALNGARLVDLLPSGTGSELAKLTDLSFLNLLNELNDRIRAYREGALNLPTGEDSAVKDIYLLNYDIVYMLFLFAWEKSTDKASKNEMRKHHQENIGYRMVPVTVLQFIRNYFSAPCKVLDAKVTELLTVLLDPCTLQSDICLHLTAGKANKWTSPLHEDGRHRIYFNLSKVTTNSCLWTALVYWRQSQPDAVVEEDPEIINVTVESKNCEQTKVFNPDRYSLPGVYNSFAAGIPLYTLEDTRPRQLVRKNTSWDLTASMHPIYSVTLFYLVYLTPRFLIPDGTYGRLVRSRSLTDLEYEIVEATVDSGHTGPLVVRVYRTVPWDPKDKTTLYPCIPKGTSFVQLVITARGYPSEPFHECLTLEEFTTCEEEVDKESNPGPSCKRQRTSAATDDAEVESPPQDSSSQPRQEEDKSAWGNDIWEGLYDAMNNLVKS